MAVPPPGYGGTELMVDQLARGLTAAGHRVILFATGDSTIPVSSAHCVATAAETGSAKVLWNCATSAITTPGTFTFRVVVPARAEWSTCLAVEAWVGGGRINPRHRCGEPVKTSPPVRRMQAWRESNPRIAAPDPVVTTTMRVRVRDLGNLRIEDPEHLYCPVVAAGAPWFMALFGGDSLLTGWMSLALDRGWPSVRSGRRLVCRAPGSTR